MLASELQTTVLDRVEVSMGSLTSKVPELLAERGWKPLDLVRRGLPFNTAYRVARGHTDVTLRIARQLVDIFELSSINDVFVYSTQDEPEEEEVGA